MHCFEVHALEYSYHFESTIGSGDRFQLRFCMFMAVDMNIEHACVDEVVYCLAELGSNGKTRLE